MDRTEHTHNIIWQSTIGQRQTQQKLTQSQFNQGFLECKNIESDGTDKTLELLCVTGWSIQFPQLKKVYNFFTILKDLIELIEINLSSDICLIWLEIFPVKFYNSNI